MRVGELPGVALQQPEVGRLRLDRDDRRLRETQAEIDTGRSEVRSGIDDQWARAAGCRPADPLDSWPARESLQRVGLISEDLAHHLSVYRRVTQGDGYRVVDRDGDVLGLRLRHLLRGRFGTRRGRSLYGCGKLQPEGADPVRLHLEQISKGRRRRDLTVDGDAATAENLGVTLGQRPRQRHQMRRFRTVCQAGCGDDALRGIGHVGRRPIGWVDHERDRICIGELARPGGQKLRVRIQFIDEGKHDDPRGIALWNLSRRSSPSSWS